MSLRKRGVRMRRTMRIDNATIKHLNKYDFCRMCVCVCACVCVCVCVCVKGCLD